MDGQTPGRGSMSLSWKERTDPRYAQADGTSAAAYHWTEGRNLVTTEVFAALSPDDMKNYEAVKVAILRRYNIKEETYRLQFCKLKTKSIYCDVWSTKAEHEQSSCVYRSGTVNDRYCTDILLDTGATKTLVWRELVCNEYLFGIEITIRCAHGDVTSSSSKNMHWGVKTLLSKQGSPAHYHHRHCWAGTYFN